MLSLVIRARISLSLRGQRRESGRGREHPSHLSCYLESLAVCMCLYDQQYLRLCVCAAVEINECVSAC